MKKRVFAILLTAALMVGLMPTNVLAEGEQSDGDMATEEAVEMLKADDVDDSAAIENDDEIIISEGEDETIETEATSDKDTGDDALPVDEESSEEDEEPTEEDEEPTEEDEESDEGDIMLLAEGMGDELDGDYAYLSNVGMTSGDNNGYAMTTGTAPWDGDDNAGNDSGANNAILRTFDTATYSVDMKTNVRDGSPYGTYKTGNLYFELVVWGTEDEIQWETGSMGWLSSKHGVYTVTSENYDEKTYQVLRGYITLEPSTDDGHAIGETTQELSLVLRALQLQNGNTVTPQFTFFMEYNDVGLTDDQYNAWGTSDYNGPIVTFDGKECGHTDENGVPLNHGKEYETVTAPEITISAVPRYNLAIVNSTESKTQQMGSYDFSTGNGLALDKDAGEKYGRLGSYGLVLQIIGKDGSSGLKGVQIPKDGDTLNFSFTLDLSSTYTASGTEYETGTTSNGYDLTKYAPLIWSFDDNHSGSNNQQDERVIPTSTKYADKVPYNELNYNSDAKYYDSCYKGGSWNIQGNGDGIYTVTVSGLTIDMDQLPWVHPGAGTSLSYNYYNPNNINYDPSDDSKNEYWAVETACLSAGELWVVQPYYEGEKNDDTYIAGMLGEGTFNVEASDELLTVSQDDTTIFDGTQAVTTDDSVGQSMALVNPGTIDQHIAYIKYNYSAYNDPLTDGCFSSAKDWILQGDQLGIETYVTNDQAEEGNTGVAYDVMIKFDDAFFEPDGTIKFSGLLNNETRTYLWAAKADKTGWDHGGLSPDADGYDSEMINATPDDLIYYSSLDALKADGATCIGVLVQYRGVMTEQQNHIHTYVLGSCKNTCETDQVYMVTPYCRSWDRDDLAAAMAADPESEYYENEGAALSALLGMTTDEVKAVVNQYIPTRTASNSLKYEDDSGNIADYPDCHWKNGDSRHPTTAAGGSSRTPTILGYLKCQYDENGCHERTSGNYWGDSCLVVGYKSGLTMKVAQETTAGGNTSEKRVFDMDTGQTVVDYEISPFIERNNGEQSEETLTYTTVEITVELPENLSYITGSSYIGGTYETAGEGKQGTVTGGVNLTEGVEASVIYTVNGTDYTVGVTLTVTEVDGKQTLTYTFTDVPVTGTETTQYLPNIYYSAEISSGAVKNGEELDVTADISCSSDAGIDPSSRSNGESTVGITVTKSTAISLVKTADHTAVDVNDEIGFTMDIGDNSDNSMEMIAVDNIPYNGDGVSTFVSEDCEVYVTEFSAYDVTATRDLSGFYFFYTTEQTFAGKTSADYPDGEYFVEDYGTADQKVNQRCLDDGWVEIETSMDERTGDRGHDVYTFTDFPEDQQVYAIVGIGTIVGQDDINMHVTLKLSDPEPGDIIVNTFSQQHAMSSGDGEETVKTYYDLSDNARARVVGRTVSGTVWLDEDMDGGIRTGTYDKEQLLAGVDVELQIKDDANGNWSTAKNLKTEEDCKTKTDESGYYEFNYVPEGEFRVVVSGSGTAGSGDLKVKPTALSSYTLADHGVTAYEAADIDESLNSKVERDTADTISGIEMPTATDIPGDTYDVDYQNAGYTKVQQLDVSKIWKSADGQTVTDGHGITAITVTVKDSHDNEWEVTLNKDNNWSVENAAEDLWYYDGNGDPVKYELNKTLTVEEDGLSKKYELKDTEISGSVDDGFAVTLENDEVTTEIDVEKVWEGDEGYEEYRPEITVKLLADGKDTGKTLTLNDSNDWKGTFSDLPIYNDDDDLSEIEYSVEEVKIDDYNTEITKNTVTNEDGTTTVSFTITNTMIEPKMTKSVAEDDYERKEESGEHMHEGEDTDGGGWGTWDDADNNQEVTYHLTLTELSNVRNLVVHDYLQDGLDFEPETVEITLYTAENVSKTLVENEDYTVTQNACSDPDCTMDGCTFEVKFTDDEEHKPFENLPEGSYMVITYKALTETHEADYEDYEDDLVNSSYMTYGASTTFLRRSAVVYAETDLYGFGVYKYAIEDGEEFILADAEFILERDDVYATFESETDEDTGEVYYMVSGWVEDKDSADTLITDADGTIRIEGLDDDAYTLIETKAPEGYQIIDESMTVVIDEDGNVTVDGNTGEKEAVVEHVVNVQNVNTLTEISGFKTWDDSDDQDGKRPESITVNLLADGEVIDTKTVTAEDDWKWSFTDLPEYNKGVKIQYSVTEEKVDDYSTEYGDDGEIINSYTPGQTSLTVVKVWNDENDADDIRPESIVVKLLKNGDETGQTVVLTADNNWTGSFTELDEYTDGKLNTYTVQENDVEGYTAEISGNQTDGYVITNTHEPEKETPETGTPGPGPANGGNGPKTGDTNNIGLWLALLAAAVVAVFAAIRMRKRS